MTVDAGHRELEQALTKLAGLVDATVAAPTPAAGLEVHRELSAFVAAYLPHLLDEETLVMPAIWQHRTDDDLARARRAFLAAMPAEDAALSRRVMLPAMSPAERAGMLRTLRAAAPVAVFTGVMEDARRILSGRDWQRLEADLAAP
ncbi:MAG TPA: hypothetical protein VF015_10630 [Acidimicrobiales bacterium]